MVSPASGAIARPDRERIERGADAEHDSDRPAGDLRGQFCALCPRGMDRRQQAPPPHRVVVAVGEQEPHRAAGFPGKLRHPGEFRRFVVEIAVHAERAGADRAQRRADAEQLVAPRIARRHHLADRRLVGVGARGGEAEGAGAQRLDGQPAHLGDVLAVGLLQANGAVAHDIDAQRVVGDLRADIDGVRPALQRIEVFGEGLPIPCQSLGQHDARNFLDAFHQVHQRRAMLRPHRREPDAAIAENRRRDPVPARRRQQRVPHRLPVIMGVHIDPARRHQEAGGVDLAPARTQPAADFHDALAGDRHVAGEGRRCRCRR